MCQEKTYVENSGETQPSTLYDSHLNGNYVASLKIQNVLLLTQFERYFSSKKYPLFYLFITKEKIFKTLKNN